MGIFETLFEFFKQVIETLNYPGIFILMTFESMVAPVPSEGVMPFAGFLIAEGKMTMALVVLVSTIGSIVGSLISYFIGYYGGKPLILKFGKYLFLNQHHLEKTEKFFQSGKASGWTVFIARFVPVIRHLISIPAGTGKMPLLPFCIVTIIGAGIWNWFLTYLGVILKEHYYLVHEYSRPLDYLIAVAVVVIIVYFIYKQYKKSQSNKKTA